MEILRKINDVSNGLSIARHHRFDYTHNNFGKSSKHKATYLCGTSHFTASKFAPHLILRCSVFSRRLTRAITLTDPNVSAVI